MFNIPSGSNEPTLMVSDYILVSTRTEGRVPASGDIIVFHYPADQRADYVKRVVGLPGDRVQLRSGQLYINDVTATMKYIGNASGKLLAISNGVIQSNSECPRDQHSRWAIIGTTHKTAGIPGLVTSPPV